MAVVLRFRVTYGRTSDFLTDVEQQISRRGLLVRVDVGAVERGAAVELEIATPVGTAAVPGSVLQPMGAAGVAIELDPAHFDALVATARRAPATDSGPPPRHERVTGDRAGRPPTAPVVPPEPAEISESL